MGCRKCTDENRINIAFDAMKPHILTSGFLLFLCSAFGQNLEWTWVSGDSVTNKNGIYGIKGVPDFGNKPGSRRHSVSWTDLSGNLWMFGGVGYAASASASNVNLNDLWKYDIAANKWTWVNGDSTDNISGVYGTKGISAPANKPGSRYGSVGWTDNTGNLWLFGGIGAALPGYAGHLNDLWKYNITTNEWSWVSGDNMPYINGVYGIKGTAAPVNKPGSRWGSTGWKDNIGNLWLMGGQGNAASGGLALFLNDLWKYDIVSNQWTWISGDNTGNNNGVYGTKGVAAVGNKPGSRFFSISWMDNTGNLWMFGGYGMNTSGIEGYLNDLWKYDIVSDRWVWMSGDNTLNNNGIYGTKGTPSPANKPGSRDFSVSWKDDVGNFWLFGGYGYATGGGHLNDLWKYNAVSNEWTWISGDNAENTKGIYGMKGISSSGNKPGSRTQLVNWKDNAGNFWLFGGQGSATSGLSGFLNDLWTFNVRSCIEVHAGNISALPDTICQNGQSNITVTGSTGSIQWQSSADGITFNDIPGDTTSLALVTGLSQTTYYRIKIIGNCGEDSSAPIKIIVNPLPTPFITAADSLICSGDSAEVCVYNIYDSYFWNTGDSSACAKVNQAGGYWLTVTDANGCSAVSDRQNISVYPIPSVSIVVQGDTLSSFGADSYQWYLNDTLIPGATSTVYIANVSGNYSVQITDNNGCVATSTGVAIIKTGVEDILANSGFYIYPNPIKEDLFIQLGDDVLAREIRITDVSGREVSAFVLPVNSGSKIKLDVSPLSSGPFLFSIYHGGNRVGSKLLFKIAP